MLAAAFCFLTAQSASAETRTFGFTGTEQIYDVPAGVNAIHVVAIGARGGRGTTSITAGGGAGGFGARLEADLMVMPGQVLFVEVGGPGEDGALKRVGTGGFNGGGSAFGAVPGGGGGGATDLRTCSINALTCAAAPNGLSSRLLVAGGGGGGGALGRGLGPIGGAGGSGGADGTDGTAAECEPGRTPGRGAGEGTQRAGGQGGAGGAAPEGMDAAAGEPGELGLGGSSPGGPTSPDTGGGGGGGYFGGGAGGSANGCHAGGGGGGSSFAIPSAGNVVFAPDESGESGLVITTIGTVAPQPPGALQIGKLTRDRRRGTATLSVQVPEAGTVSLAGKGLFKASRSVRAAATVKLPIKATGGPARRLRRAGAAEVTVRVSFTPTGGGSTSKTRRIKLLRAR